MSGATVAQSFLRIDENSRGACLDELRHLSLPMRKTENSATSLPIWPACALSRNT